MNAPTLSFLGRYRLVKVLGQGAMGVVYEAEDARLGRSVAIKTVLRSHMMEETTAIEFSRRFEREAQAAAKLSHPNIVTVYDFGEHEDIAYIVMEFVRGRELGHFFAANEKFTLHDTVRIMGELLAALDVAHRQGVVHRDVKPANVLIDGAGHVKLTDFGVARVTAAGQNRTMPGTLVGTPSYMSPEQILGLSVGSRADIFGAGVILYQFLTGQRPFIGGGPFAVQRKIVQDQAPPPSQINPAVPPAFDAIVERALAKQPEHRYESAAAFAADLEHALIGVPAPAAPLDIDLPDRTVSPPSLAAPDRDTEVPTPAAPTRPPAPAASTAPPTVAPYAWASTLPPTRPPSTPAQTTLAPPEPSLPPPTAEGTTAGTAVPAAAGAPALAPTPSVDRTEALGEATFRSILPGAEPTSSSDDPDATVILLRTAVPGTLAAAAPSPAAESAATAIPVKAPGSHATAAPPRLPALAGGGAAAAAAAAPRAAVRTAGVAATVKPAALRQPAPPPSPSPRSKSSITTALLAGAGVALVALAVLLAVKRPWSNTVVPVVPTAVGMPSAAAPPATAADSQPAPVPVAPLPPPAPVDLPAVAAPDSGRSGQTTGSHLPAAGTVTTPPAPDAERVPLSTQAPAPTPTTKPAPTPAPAPAPRRTTTEAARTPAQARPEAQLPGVTARCNDLLHRMQLGDPLSAEQSEFFQSRCTR
jgi:serine/threonine-protein kinase